jgi:hypothetical protein
VFGQQGHVWFVSEAVLLRTIDAAQTFEIVDSVDSALAVGFGKPIAEAEYPAVYLSGTVATRADRVPLWRAPEGV